MTNSFQHYLLLHKGAFIHLFLYNSHEWLSMIFFSCFPINESCSDATFFHFSKSMGNNHVIFFIQTRTEIFDNENSRLWKIKVSFFQVNVYHSYTWYYQANKRSKKTKLTTLFRSIFRWEIIHKNLSHQSISFEFQGELTLCKVYIVNMSSMQASKLSKIKRNC